MTAAGQVFLEFVLIMLIFLIFLGAIAKNIPITFSKASPILAAKVETQLQTGAGFYSAWETSAKPVGGVKDEP